MHAVRRNGRATVSYERGGAPVMAAVAARQNVALLGFNRWCWWLEEVDVMAKQLWSRQIGRWSYVSGERLWRSCGGAWQDLRSAAVRQSEQEKAKACEWSERWVRGA